MWIVDYTQETGQKGILFLIPIVILLSLTMDI
jgi:hypothetical protein